MKQNTFHKYTKIILSFILIASLWSCERDDICASATPTTPHLIIRFYNINERSETKTVRRMNVFEENSSKYILLDKTLDSIILPLRIDALDTTNTTRFIIERDGDYDTDEDDNTVSNIDTLEVSYTPELIYVSRACGYKSIFNNLVASRASDENNWILDVQVINNTINNEDAAHINIYH
ncbi:DUF6452 family protein [Gelidibacter salicanalis]|uniref:Uncharacterized protein n=1 Tax=Gelidibacter salicanalis TaxID=291193 RepID=A0A934KUU3_9FLAO|nr:DUF6452 family protein [Gelidibacter salicanalis]MBJ7881067.1 hypothetical protein [Gelidibacter salicanalis]